MASADDIPAMMNLEVQSHGAAHWSGLQYERIFSRTDISGTDIGSTLERFAWAIENDGLKSAGNIPDKKPELLAFLVAKRVHAEWELENIAVMELVRRQGAATLLLRELIAHARRAGGESIGLEVRQSNTGARAFYEKFGFREAGIRKAYYDHPPEDAVVYRRSLA